MWTKMAYDKELAERIRTLLSGRTDVAEQKLFGGLCFMVRGHMCCAISGRGGLLVRLGPDAPAFLFSEPHAAPMEMRGRIMADYLRVAPDGYQSEANLKKWVARATDFVETLPKKAKKTLAKKTPAKKTVAKKKAPAKKAVRKAAKRPPKK
jgi:TfoX/Sxy family transcriptional regulator of competence genes